MRRAFLLVTAALATLAVPATADAVDRTVSKTGADSGSCTTSACLTIDYAVDQANAGDRIVIGAGTYNENVYALVRLDFVGVGSGDVDGYDPASTTVIAPTTTGAALELADGGSVRNLRTQGNGGGSYRSSQAAGLSFRATSGADAGPFDYEVSGVFAANNVDSATQQRSAISITDSGANGTTPNTPVSVTITDSTIYGVPLQGNLCSDAVSQPGQQTGRVPTEVTIRNTTFAGVGCSAIFTRNLLTLDRVDMAPGFDRGVDMINGQVTATRSVLRGNINGVLAYGTAPATPATAQIRDSVLQTTGGFSTGSDGALGVETLIGGTATVDVTGSTLYAAEAEERAISLYNRGLPSSGGAATVRLFNSIAFKGGPQAATTVSTGGTVTGWRLEATNSSVGPITDASGVLTYAPTGAVSGDPQFVNLTPGSLDLRLQATSPFIDAGSASALTAGETDLLGAARNQDGNKDCASAPDLGAYELPGRDPATCVPPQQPTPQPKPTVPPAKNAKPTLTKLKLVKKKGKTYLSFTLSEKAKVKFTVQRKKGKKFRTLGTFTRNAKKGKNSIALPTKLKGKGLGKGSFKILALPTDSAGLKGARRTATFKRR